MIAGNAPVLAVDVDSLASAITEIQRRGVDGTVVPLFVDYTNQRIIIGSTAISAAPAKVELVSGDFKVVTNGNGIILPTASGNYYRLIITEVVGEDGSTFGVVGTQRV